MNQLKKTISSIKANLQYKKQQDAQDFIGSLPKDLAFTNKNGNRINLVKKEYRPMPPKTKGSRHV